jgi:hypothetical protein
VLGQFGFKAIHVSVDETDGMGVLFQNSYRQLQPIEMLLGLRPYPKTETPRHDKDLTMERTGE